MSPRFLFCEKMFLPTVCLFARAPGKGHRIHAPLLPNLLTRSRGWAWVEEWKEDVAAFREKAKGVRRKVPWDGTCPEIRGARAEKKEYFRAQRVRKKMDEM